MHRRAEQTILPSACQHRVGVVVPLLSHVQCAQLMQHHWLLEGGRCDNICTQQRRAYMRRLWIYRTIGTIMLLVSISQPVDGAVSIVLNLRA